MSDYRWIELKEAFAVLIDLPPDERAEHLAALRESDPELSDELIELFEADGRADSLLGSWDFAPASNPAVSDENAVPADAADPYGFSGRTVAHFRVLEVLGSGGSSVVYRAEDEQSAQVVALKFPLPKYAADPIERARFRKEARAATALDHPNVCTVYESGETDDGKPFLSMAYYPGETLEARLASWGALPVSVGLRVAHELLQGLGAAHAAGVVHRGLKPGNVMLTADGGVKILDFGLARAHDPTITSPERQRRTVAYMSPEQLDGEPVDRRSDIWSFGAVFYEMLTGKAPFGGGHELSTVYSILHDDPEPPSRIRPEVPPVCDEVVAGLLRKKPNERFANADEVLAALTGRNAIPNRPQRGTGLLRRRRTWVIAAAGAVLLAVGSAQAYEAGLILRHKPHPEAYRLYLEGKKARQIDGRSQLDSAFVRFRAATSIDPKFAPAWAWLGDTYVARSNLAHPSPDLILLGRDAASRAIRLDPRLADGYSAMGMVLASRGSRAAYDSADRSFRRALSLDSTAAWTNHVYSLYLTMVGRVDDALDKNQRALDADPLGPPQRALKGMLLYLKGQPSLARDTLREAIELSPEYVVTPYYLGVIEANDGKFASAQTHLEQARTDGEFFPGVRSALAYVYGKRGRKTDRDMVLARMRADTSDDRARIDRALSWAVMGDVNGAYSNLRNEVWDLPSVHNLVVNPLLKKFRDDRRYAALAKRIGIVN
jgi:serine/threonine protein kinase/Flp pilus assembly protein TadD